MKNFVVTIKISGQVPLQIYYCHHCQHFIRQQGKHAIAIGLAPDSLVGTEEQRAFASVKSNNAKAGVAIDTKIESAVLILAFSIVTKEIARILAKRNRGEDKKLSITFDKKQYLITVPASIDTIDCDLSSLLHDRTNQDLLNMDIELAVGQLFPMTHTQCQPLQQLTIFNKVLQMQYIKLRNDTVPQKNIQICCQDEA